MEQKTVRELTEEEVRQVSGGGSVYDFGSWVGVKLGELHNVISERVHNDPFQRVYQ